MGLGSRKSLGSSFDVKTHLYFGFFLRFALIMYGEHRDKTSVTKYTDIDYHVFSDAAREVVEGRSPFNRHTYRYTPFLAFLLIPNIKCNFLFGKFLFSSLDILATRLIYKILIFEGHSKKRSTSASLLWLYNPLVVAISTRGNADSLVAIFTLILVYFLKIRLPILSGIILGIAIHFKLYPVIYVLPIYISFTHRPEISPIFKKFYPNLNKIRFLGGMILSFALLTGVAYALYGDAYIEHGFMYHVKRIDTRHNFSIYFYLLYLYSESSFPSLTLATFVPQMVLTFAFGLKYSSYRDLTFAMFTQTAVFVVFNKVVTSQYFIWYLAFVPLVSTRLNFSLRKTVILCTIWLGAQASWLFPAYLFEFEGMNTFIPIWLESIAFFCCNIGILLTCISSYTQVLVIHYSAKKVR